MTFVLDLASNPHKKLLALALDARRTARVAGLGNLAASAYYLGVLHACAAATGAPDDEIRAWLDFHDTALTPYVVPLALLGDDAVDLAVRSRRLARLTTEPVVYRYWQGMADLLTATLRTTPDVVDAFVALADPTPEPLIDAVPGDPVDIRHS